MVRSVQEMSDVTVVDLYTEIEQEVRELMLVLSHLAALKDHGVHWVDSETLEPYIPDNVVLFPAQGGVH